MADEDSGLSPEAKLLALSDDQMSELIAKYLSRLNLTPEKIRDPSATAYKKALLKKIELDPDGTIPDPVLKGYDGREDEGDGDVELGTAVDELTNPTIGGRASLTVSIPSTTEEADTLSPLKIPSADELSPSTASGGNLFTQMNLGTPPLSFTGYGYVPALGTPDAAPASDPLAGPAVGGAEHSVASKAQVVGGFGSIPSALMPPPGVTTRGPCRRCGEAVTTDQMRSKGSDGIYSHDQCPLEVTKSSLSDMSTDTSTSRTDDGASSPGRQLGPYEDELEDATPVPWHEEGTDDTANAERECLAREFRWLLADEVPAAFMKIGSLLKECLKDLTVPLTASKLSSSPIKLPRRPGSMNDDDLEGISSIAAGLRSKQALKAAANAAKANKAKSEAIRLVMEGGMTVGTAKIENTSITKLKLDWKMPKSKGGHHPAHLEAQLQKGMTLSIEQLRATINKIKLSLTEIEDTITQQRYIDSQQNSVLIMKRLLTLLISAKESLTTAIQRVCEKTIKREMFSPPLPKEVLLDAYLDHGELCVEATVTVETSAPAAATRHFNSLVPRRVGALFQDDSGRCCEVTAIHRAYGTIPVLSTVLSNLFVMVDFAQKMQDKLLVFRGITLSPER